MNQSRASLYFVQADCVELAVGGAADLAALLGGERPGERIGADFVGGLAVVKDDAVEFEATGEGVLELRQGDARFWR